jgi:hypothetical protein
MTRRPAAALVRDTLAALGRFRTAPTPLDGKTRDALAHLEGGRPRKAPAHPADDEMRDALARLEGGRPRKAPAHHADDVTRRAALRRRS